MWWWSPQYKRDIEKLRQVQWRAARSPERLRAGLALHGEAATEGQRGSTRCSQLRMDGYEKMEPDCPWSCKMKDKEQ